MVVQLHKGVGLRQSMLSYLIHVFNTMINAFTAPTRACAKACYNQCTFNRIAYTSSEKHQAAPSNGRAAFYKTKQYVSNTANCVTRDFRRTARLTRSVRSIVIIGCYIYNDIIRVAKKTINELAVSLLLRGILGHYTTQATTTHMITKGRSA